ncbi:hypothetical protein D7V94_15690 [Parablautia intestinalis]|jgi:hypothetical protein|uniref:SGNH/GDSL hydrolase family protein n=1 Tax=Parablautia intestinalis TaxID=2320100 RepID=A0A3A9AG63_9FIRM|nr:hypothetical protein [Parablautia intestinalis]MCI8616469.1 hypothetical protein [Lachnospiraceae bacterium]RKI90064.1 hypothetical protein D7V94_15690 [Parablautia intestinalis]
MKVLFIGNSHTFVHYVPARVTAFCQSQGQLIDAVMLTHPGMGLEWHLQQFQTYFNLICGGYDAVILQHNAHPFPGRDSLLKAGEQMASLTPKSTRIYLYMTWSEKNNPQGQIVMSEAYEALAEKTGATICPVGKIWWQVVNAHPEEDLYFADGEHSSVLGASLSAAVIGRTLLGLDISPAVCYADAKELCNLSLDPKMIDLV